MAPKEGDGDGVRECERRGRSVCSLGGAPGAEIARALIGDGATNVEFGV